MNPVAQLLSDIFMRCSRLWEGEDQKRAIVLHGSSTRSLGRQACLMQ